MTLNWILKQQRDRAKQSKEEQINVWNKTMRYEKRKKMVIQVMIVYIVVGMCCVCV